jgi:periplasmic protein CpxP/Spy
MNKIRFLTIVSIVLLLSNLAMIGFVLLRKQPLHDRGPRDVIIEKLHFDAQQIAAYDTLISAHRKTIRSQNDEILNLKKNLYHTLNLQGSTLVKDSLLLKISQSQATIEQTHYTHFEDIRSLCKENQRQDFEVFTKELTDYFGSTQKRKNQ